MSLTTQAKVLRVLENRQIERLGGDVSIPVDGRVVSVTHKNLEAEIAEGRFRQDLYYRLRVVTIEVPPLRDRREDIPILAADMLTRVSSLYGLRCRDLDPEAMRLLVQYSWPGNVEAGDAATTEQEHRELAKLIDRAVARGALHRNAGARKKSQAAKLAAGRSLRSGAAKPTPPPSVGVLAPLRRAR